MKTLCMAIAAAIAATTSAFAQDSASVRVRFDDLNLNSRAGAEHLERRLNNAAEQVCGVSDLRDLRARTEDERCKAAALAAAHATIASRREAGPILAELTVSR